MQSGWQDGEDSYVEGTLEGVQESWQIAWVCMKRKMIIY